ncbi:hypothetical protein [Nocardia arthritidis]|uniref:Uncharacterized protein n=1 Tax=Nocardia arthritidis TaxID=228602 RepID=A0A6G9Y9G6_9NOCA|nr:hypothetical protein [Nocardia arthritidis]QIS09905.1 hypothetical protein F5544_10025 [Nocardia arthritidis]
MTIEKICPTTHSGSDRALALIPEGFPEGFNPLEGVPDDVMLRTALEGCSTKKDMMRLVCELFGDPTTDDVRSVLARCGAKVSRQHASNVVNDWRRTQRYLSRPADHDRQAPADTLPASPDGVRVANREDTVTEATTPKFEQQPVDASMTELRTHGEIDASSVDEPVPDDRRTDTSPFGGLTVDDVTDDESGRDARAVVAPQTSSRPIRIWPVLLIALPAAVAVWSGWVGLGDLTGFGVIHPLPGIWDSARLNSAITLPIGVEAYASYALYVWLSGRIRTAKTVNYAKWSALGSLVLGAAGQIAYHLMQAAGTPTAPWPITTLVACLPVVVLGMGAALTHMLMRENHTE